MTKANDDALGPESRRQRHFEYGLENGGGLQHELLRFAPEAERNETCETSARFSPVASNQALKTLRQTSPQLAD